MRGETVPAIVLTHDAGSAASPVAVYPLNGLMVASEDVVTRGWDAKLQRIPGAAPRLKAASQCHPGARSAEMVA